MSNLLRPVKYMFKKNKKIDSFESSENNNLKYTNVKEPRETEVSKVPNFHTHLWPTNSKTLTKIMKQHFKLICYLHNRPREETDPDMCYSCYNNYCHKLKHCQRLKMKEKRSFRDVSFLFLFIIWKIKLYSNHICFLFFKNTQ